MADYTDLPDTAVGIGGVPSGTTVTALRDNAIAIAEGAVGAPRIVDAALDVTVAYYGGKIAQLSLGSVGSYALLRFAVGQSAHAAGSTHAASGLRYTSASGSNLGATPSGTWRMMGETPIATAVDSLTTLFLRIS